VEELLSCPASTSSPLSRLPQLFLQISTGNQIDGLRKSVCHQSRPNRCGLVAKCCKLTSTPKHQFYFLRPYH
jgi:hypothetical protein